MFWVLAGTSALIFWPRCWRHVLETLLGNRRQADDNDVMLSADSILIDRPRLGYTPAF